ncbi:MAG: hypothetical protein IIZ25_09220, partial [Thermoguttaceae bacterium]|nr:hypothetical protein [Thermoguttaceae bacterium]
MGSCRGRRGIWESRSMENTNKYLNRVKNLKRDEFYTRLDDIESELSHYTEQFRGAVVYCNCDLYHQ